jgi:hypothetical protein
MKVERNRPTYLAALITLLFPALVVSVTWALEDPATMTESLTMDQSGESSQVRLPNFSGHWVLNIKESDDFAEVMREAMGGGQSGRGGGMEGGRGGGMGGGHGGGKGGGGGGRGGGKGGGGGGRGSSDSSGDQERQIKAQQKLARAQVEYSRLDIFHDGIELNVTNGLDISRLLFTDGRQMNIWTQRGEATATASWQERTLVVSWKTSQDTMSRIRYYTLSEGGQQLTMTESRRFPGQDKTVKITMVYNLEK